MFYYNGFSINIQNDKVVATQGKLKFVFNSIEAALEVLTS